jgi:hypothetical protein
VTLEICCLCAAFQLHENHVMVFHVDDGREAIAFEGRILFIAPFCASGNFRRTASESLWTISEADIHHSAF